MIDVKSLGTSPQRNAGSKPRDHGKTRLDPRKRWSPHNADLSYLCCCYRIIIVFP